MKLNPKHASFCPGCPKKLSLGTSPVLTINLPEEKKDAKIITLTKPSKKQSLQSTSLF